MEKLRFLLKICRNRAGVKKEAARLANFVDSGYFRQRMTANMRDLGEIFERTYPKRLDFPEMSAIM